RGPERACVPSQGQLRSAELVAPPTGRPPRPRGMGQAPVLPAPGGVLVKAPNPRSLVGHDVSRCTGRAGTRTAVLWSAWSDGTRTQNASAKSTSPRLPAAAVTPTRPNAKRTPPPAAQRRRVRSPAEASASPAVPSTPPLG